MIKCPGIDISTGSLGQGMACAAGMALGGKMNKKDYKVFCVLGDGEAQEGEIWEAANTANKYKLDNLIVFVDVNRLQLDGTCEEVMPNGDLGAKFKAFGWNVMVIDGHNFDEIRAAFKEARETKGQPTAIIAKTIKGKDVSFMENNAGWHGKAPNDGEYAIAMEDLEKVGEKLCQM
jgi:transketolase